MNFCWGGINTDHAYDDYNPYDLDVMEYNYYVPYDTYYIKRLHSQYYCQEFKSILYCDEMPVDEINFDETDYNKIHSAELSSNILPTYDFKS